MKVKKLVSVAEYCKLEGISKQAAYKRIKTGKLKSKKVHGLILVLHQN